MKNGLKKRDINVVRQQEFKIRPNKTLNWSQEDDAKLRETDTDLCK